MTSNTKWRLAIIAALFLIGFYFIYPTIQWYSLDKNIRDKIELSASEEEEQSEVASVSTTNQKSTNLYSDILQTDEKEEKERLSKIKEKSINLGLDLQGGMHIVLQAKPETNMSAKQASDIVDRALEVIRNRVDKFGVSEPSITKQGIDRIVVQLPGMKDPTRAEKLLNVQGALEFKLVDDELSKEANFENYKEGILKSTNRLPEDEEIRFLWQRNSETKKMVRLAPIVVKKTPSLTGAFLKEAEVTQDQFGEFAVSFVLNPEGADIFANVTGNNVGKKLAIVLDGRIRSAPVIKERLHARSQISGNFTLEEAKDLALILRAGAIPAKLEFIEKRTVGPSLGRDSIKSGIKAGIIGALAVVMFMLIYYKISGLIADFALFLNIYFIIAILASFGFTLTLPGIAGIVLTIGMSVDANVLIYERIKEELRAGKTIKAAITAGFQRALSAIMDSNITTLIAAFVLMQFGTGPIKGFAVTLFIGVAVNLFTATFCTRTIFDLWTGLVPVKKLSI